MSASTSFAALDGIDVEPPPAFAFDGVIEVSGRGREIGGFELGKVADNEPVATGIGVDGSEETAEVEEVAIVSELFIAWIDAFTSRCKARTSFNNRVLSEL